jgi:hypothetical protein
MFRIGQRVKCVKPSTGEWHPIIPGLISAEVGGIYTVRDVLPPRDDRGPALLLCEIRNPIHRNGFEYSFWAFRFVPIEEKKTDISIFTEILKTGKIKRTKKAKEPV